MFGNRGIYHKGWTAVTRHKTPWLLVGEQAPAFDDDVWELYDTSADWTQVEDLAAQHPERLARAAAAVPDRGDPQQRAAARRPRRRAAHARRSPGRPTLVKGNRQRLFGGMGRLSESSVVSIKNKSHAVTAEIVVPEGGAQGVIIAQGGSIGGWSLYAQGRQAALLLQPARHPALLRRRRPRDPGRHAPGADGVRLRRRPGSARAAPSRCTSTASRSARARSPRPRR